MLNERTIMLTPAGKVKLEEELNLLITVKKPGLSARIAEATEHGDVSDNSEYEGLKDDFAHIEARIRELEHTLERAEVVEHPADEGRVSFGSTVTIRADDGFEETWTLVSHEEADTREGTISTESPVGHALVGRRVGESATVKTPGGEIIYTVVGIA